MRKLFLILTAVTAMFICTSCNENVKIPEVIAAVDRDATVTYNGTEYDCHITYVNGNTASVEMKSPENLQGLTFRKTEGNQTVSLGKLICKSDSFYFGDDCIGTQIMQAFDGVKQENIKFMSLKNDLYLFSGKNDSSLTFLTDSDGNIQTLSTQNLKIKMS